MDQAGQGENRPNVTDGRTPLQCPGREVVTVTGAHCWKRFCSGLSHWSQQQKQGWHRGV